MGTNFYWKQEEKPPCECCNRPFDEENKAIHIGKSSAGWTFALHVTDEIQSLADWIKIWENEPGFIEDEYGATISVEEMIDNITKRYSKVTLNEIHHYDGVTREEFLSINNAIEGPKNLLRRKIGQFCIGYGDGTWDLCPGEFS